MKITILVTTSVMLLSQGTAVLAASATPDHGASQQPLILAAAQSHHGEGTVTAIDKQGKRIEVKHGPIKSLGWMGMKMFFNVDNARLLESVKLGDKVDFEFIQTRDNRLVVTNIEVK